MATERTPRLARPFPLREAAAWALVGIVFACFLIATQAAALGSLASLLLVGADSALADPIGAVLGDLNTVDGVGNDGQIYFAVGSDLLDNRSTSLLIPSPSVRYQRILFPFLASIGGALEGPALLWGMVAVVVVSSGTLTVATMGLAARFGVGRWVAAGLFANIGLVLGIRLLTPDPLGWALMSLAIWAAVSRRPGWSVALFALAGLAKEPYLAGAIAVAMWLWMERRRWQAAVTVAVPFGVLAGWDAIISSRLASTDAPSHLGLPLSGFIGAIDYWDQAPPRDLVYTGLAVAALVVAFVGGLRTRSALLRWCAWGWVAIGAVASDWIWFFGNASVRVLAPALAFGLLALLHSLGNHPAEEGDPAADLVA